MLREHPWNGSPSKPGSQAHVALWSTTEHTACRPQACTHGSLHFWDTQANAAGHSALIVHSGRQLGGAPIKPGWQLHAGISPELIHIELGPHGDGWHGSMGISGRAVKFKRWYKFKHATFKDKIKILSVNK